MSSSLNTWSRALLAVLTLLCVLDVVAIGAGAVLAVVDATTASGDGVGTALGLVLAGFATIALAITLALVLLARSARAVPDLRRLNLTARLSAVIAVTVLVLVLWLAVGDALGLVVLVTVALPAVILLVPAAGTLAALRTEVRAGPTS